MKRTINFYEFDRAFYDKGRENQFSYDGRKALYDYLIEYTEDSTDTEIELDVIAFCCEFTECESIEDFQENYGDEFGSIEDIENETSVIPIPNSDGFIVQNF